MSAKAWSWADYQRRFGAAETPPAADDAALTAAPVEPVRCMPVDDVSIGRVTVVIGGDAYAELARIAARDGVTPAGAAATILRECLIEEG